MMRMRFIPLLLSAPLLVMQQAAAQSLAPNDLVRKVVINELALSNADHTHWMYRETMRMPPPVKEKTVVETRSGELTCLNKIDGRPLTPEQRRIEDLRIKNYVADNDQQLSARRNSASDNKESEELFTILPDAFLFKYAEASGDNVKLTFVPNPDFHAHNAEAYVFHKMDGFVVLNTKENRLVEIAGKLTNGVLLLGGLLGHLDPGGTFDARQEEVGPGHWKVSRLQLNMSGKMLFFKTINEQQDEIHSHFEQVPEGLTLAQAEQMLHERSADKAAE
jgi:hypothetical protein